MKGSDWVFVGGVLMMLTMLFAVLANGLIESGALGEEYVAPMSFGVTMIAALMLAKGVALFNGYVFSHLPMPSRELTLSAAVFIVSTAAFAALIWDVGLMDAVGKAQVSVLLGAIATLPVYFETDHWNRVAERLESSEVLAL